MKIKNKEIEDLKLPVLIGRGKFRKKYNTLLNNYEALLNDVKNNCFNAIYSKLNDDQSVLILKKENKLLRQKIKTLKEIIKEGSIDNKFQKKVKAKNYVKKKIKISNLS